MPTLILASSHPSAKTLALWVLAGFLGSFIFIRTSARLMRSPKVTWWPGSVTSGDLHIHHLVWGIILLLLCGFLGFGTEHVTPWTQILAVLFGIGAGFTLDEFALWLRLEDVYWAEQGRDSPVGWVGAIRLARPGSRWARRRYADNPKKLEKAAVRGDRWDRRRRKFQDIVGGTPTDELEPPPRAEPEPDASKELEPAPSEELEPAPSEELEPAPSKELER
jgi:hypothetical protein